MIKDTLLKVLEPIGPSSAESGIAAVIADMVRGYVDELKTDALGNLIAIRHSKDGKGRRLMLSAHMDQIGMIVTDADDRGFLRVYPVGGVNPWNAVNRLIRFPGQVMGVVSYETDYEDPMSLTFMRVYVDVGANSREEALSRVGVGTIGAWDFQPAIMGNRIAAPCMDDRAGCAVLIETLMNTTKGDNEIIAVFSTQEEVGLRGATAAAYSQQPDFAIALDVTLCGDLPKTYPHNVKMGKGAAIKVKDSGQVCSIAVKDLLVRTADANKVPYQMEVLLGGTTDASAIQLSRGGVPAGTISIPCRYVHTQAETVDMGDMQACVDLLTAVFNQAI